MRKYKSTITFYGYGLGIKKHYKYMVALGKCDCLV